MRVRTTVASTVLAVAMTFPMAGIALAHDLDCADFATQPDAQAVYDKDRSDPHRLDRDKDGIACEARPGGRPGTGEAVQNNGGKTNKSPDRGSTPKGSVEAGAGGTASEGSELLLPASVLGGAALAAAGVVLIRRRASGQGD